MTEDDNTGNMNVMKAQSNTPLKRSRGIRRALYYLPTWLIALLLLIPILILDHFEILSEIRCLFNNPWGFLILISIALFIPAAVKRWNWRHVLVMLILAVASFAIKQVLSRITIGVHSEILAVLIATLPLLILGLAEMLLQRKLRWKNLAWIVGGVVAVSAVSFFVLDYLWATGWTVSLPNRYGNTGRQSLVGVIKLPLLTVLTWLTIPACFRVAKSGSRAKRLTLGVTFAGAVAAYVVFVYFLWYPLMEMSVKGDGPFEKAAAVGYLELRGKDSDFELIRQGLEEADWTKPSMRLSDNWSYIGDWRQMGIAALARRNSADTAERLSRLLRHQPRWYLASDAARILAKHKKYETVPILMRYALCKNSNCIEALDQMNLPRAALPIMRDRIASKARFSGLRLKQFSEETCERLKYLLGDDAGREVDAWLQLYDRVITERPTPLPELIRKETDRVILSMLRYFILGDDWAHASLVWGRQKGWSLDKTREINRLVPKPNWDVITTEELEKEIKAYDEQVKTAIDKHFPPQSQPAENSPASTN